MGMFSQIMQARRNPAETARREEVAEVAGWGKAACGVGAVVSGVAALASFVAQRSFPLLALSSLAALAFREGAVVLWNVEAVMSDSETEGWTEELVSHRVTENTWIVDFLFRTTIQRELKST